MLRSSHHVSEKKTEITEAIVDAAERLLRTYGYQKMTMTDLAAEAGIGVGTTYLHFASKSDVAVAVAERYQSLMLDDLIQLSTVNEAPDVLLANLLWHRVKKPYEFVRSRLASSSWQQISRQGMEFMDDIRNSNPTKLDAWKVNEAAVIANVISNGSDAGVFYPVDPMKTAHTLLQAMCGFFPKNLDQNDFINPDDFEINVRNVIKLLVNGISKSKKFDG